MGVIQRKRATTAEKASLNLEAGGAPWLGVISQEGGKDGLGEAAPQLGRGTCTSTLLPPHLKPQSPRDHSPPFFP